MATGTREEGAGAQIPPKGGAATGAKPGRRLARLRAELERLKSEFQTVSALGMRLSREMDVQTLLPAIVTAARRFTAAEAGTLYVRRGASLSFAVAQNERIDPGGDGTVEDLARFELPIDDSSLAGLAALERRTLNIADAREHPSFSRSSRDRFGYEVASMLIVPLIEQDGAVLGVLQLMNARDEEGAPTVFEERAAELCEVLASHAATALVIANLYAELHAVFDSLVSYTASAIDARDPCTAGHSSRVASYSVSIAKELGGFSDGELRELRFAGILHDVGKIGVRECVLAKSDKLPPEVAEIVEHRFLAACEAALAQAAKVAEGDPSHPAFDEARRHVEALEDDLALVRKLRLAGWMEDVDVRRLERIGVATWIDYRGNERRLLSDLEVEALLVRKGTLTDAERREIQSHVQLSWEFLSKLPFPRDLAKVPELAWSHHERLDGSGYPRGLRGSDILMGARILAVADVFDALTAEDRPYKQSIAPDRAMAIIDHETSTGAYDAEVVEALRRLVARGRLIPSADGREADVVPFDAARDAWR